MIFLLSTLNSLELAADRRSGVLNNLADSQESTCTGDPFLIKLEAPSLQLYLKSDYGTAVNFCHTFRNFFFIELLWTTAFNSFYRH